MLSLINEIYLFIIHSIHFTWLWPRPWFWRNLIHRQLLINRDKVFCNKKWNYLNLLYFANLNLQRWIMYLIKTLKNIFIDWEYFKGMVEICFLLFYLFYFINYWGFVSKLFIKHGSTVQTKTQIHAKTCVM